MRFFLLRHTEAGDAPQDFNRTLTVRGRKDAVRMGRHLEALGVRFDLAFTSPLARARETAALVLKRCPLRAGAQLEVTDHLQNGTSGSAFRRWLTHLPDVESVLLVGHEPSLGMHARAFLGIRDAEGLMLPKGGVVRIDTTDRRRGSLRFFIGPKQLP